jgi:chloramphenicol 3-O-phosphotransferase
MVLALIDAQHRDRMLADPEWTRALRESLEAFVAQGVMLPREKDRSVSLYAGGRSPGWVRWRQAGGFRGWHRDGAALAG